MASSPAGKTEDDDPLLGATIDGRYAVTRRLGAGGMGAVYEALHAGSGRRVAVKVILGDRLAKNEKLLTRFQREARAAGKVDSPHIAQVLDTGVDAETETPFLVMEFLEGEDLHATFKRLKAIPVDLALRIMAQALRGLDRAHEASVVHRDIKPANLFLARSGGGRVVKLLDFGIAKEIDPLAEETGGLTSTGALLGSPLYMSPEQVRNRKQLDHRTDLWSMGIVMFQALAGRTPFHDADSIGDLIMSICSSPAPWLQDLAPWVPAEVAAIVRTAIAIDPEQRFPTARAMLDAVLQLLPNGEAIHEGMLVSVDMATRACVAPRVPTDGGSAPAHPGMTGSAPGFAASSHPSSPAFPAWPAAPSGARAPLVSTGHDGRDPQTPASADHAGVAPATHRGPPGAGASFAAAPPVAPASGPAGVFAPPSTSAGYPPPYAQMGTAPGAQLTPFAAAPIAAVTDAGMASTRGGVPAPRPSRAPIAALALVAALVAVAGGSLAFRLIRSAPAAVVTVNAAGDPAAPTTAKAAEAPSAPDPTVNPSAPVASSEALPAQGEPGTSAAPAPASPKPTPRASAQAATSAGVLNASAALRASAARPARGKAKTDDETSRK